MQGDKFDRTTQDMGNIVGLEHVNVKIPDQVTSTEFWVSGMGFTRDPYVMVGTTNMWINVGQQQFHMPTGEPQVVRAHVGLVVPDLEALTTRLAAVKEKLEATKFSYTVEDKFVLVTCPWGNRLRVHGAGPEWGEMRLGMPYVEFTVPAGHAEGIARFYQQIMGAPAVVTPTGSLSCARVQVGTGQDLIFKETKDPIPEFDGHHIAIYVTNFSGPHGQLKERGLISEESNPVQYRFKDIVDPDSGKLMFVIEHEVRSFTHPMYARPLMNRNAVQRQATYQRGRDAYYPGA
jgi:catechol 2,3-dioxygenase-like lactoylglutathione lyase family enzyme